MTFFLSKKTALIYLLFLSFHFVVLGQNNHIDSKHQLLLKKRTWTCIKIEDDPPSCRWFAGTIYMTFLKTKNPRFNSKSEKHPTKFTFVCQLKLKDKLKILDYVIKNNTICFTNTDNWPSYKIISISKKQLVLQHNLSNESLKWTMIPLKHAERRKKLKRKRKKQK